MEKKYEKALLKARVAKQNTESAVTIGILEEIFPELEKQGEQKPQRIISAEVKEVLFNKPNWSEEDEVTINRIVGVLENLNVADNNILLKDINWLNSLKERIE